MKLFKSTIFTGFAPNLRIQDFLLACSFLFFPWRWPFLRVGKYTKEVEEWLQEFLSADHAFSVDSGRSALLLSLKSIGVKEGDEVILPGYTCVVVTNAIRYLGAVPVYVDVGDDLNVIVSEIEQKITTKTKALVVQHTFGVAADLDAIVEIAGEKNIKIIEDCAHSLGGEYHERKLGTFGDIGFFSFGSNKIISSVRGGAVVTNSDKIAKNLEEQIAKLKKQKLSELLRHLLHFPLFFISKPMYNFGGKIILGCAKKIKLLPNIISKKEKRGVIDNFYPSLFSNSLARITLSQLQNLAKNIKHRERIAKHYREELKSKIEYQEGEEGRVWLYYTIFTKDHDALASALKKQGVIAGTDWSGSVIVPKDIDLTKTNYQPGTCPNAEKISFQVLNLPTNLNIDIRKADKIVKIVNENF